MKPSIYGTKAMRQTDYYRDDYEEVTILGITSEQFVYMNKDGTIGCDGVGAFKINKEDL